MQKAKFLAAAFIVVLHAVAFAAPAQLENDDRDKPVMIKDGDPLPKVTARSAVVMEAKTGLVLYTRDGDEKMYPASTTKMMTLITALEEGELSDSVRVSKNAAGMEGSTLWLEEGDRIPLGDLLYGMMMVSGNDGAAAIAEHVGGSTRSFARMMNEKAKKIGATHTNFVNPSGLPDEKHFTTARDLALIAAYGYQNPDFVKIVSTKEKFFSWVKDEKHFLRNENQMLWLYKGANGVKTGYTDTAGRCLVSGAERNGIQLVAVVLDSLYMWNDSIALLDYGFSKVRPKTIVKAGEDAGSAPVQFGDKKKIRLKTATDITLPTSGAEIFYEKNFDVPAVLSAPIKKGEAVGTVEILLDGKKIAETKILAAEGVERKSFFLLILDTVNKFIGKIFR